MTMHISKQDYFIEGMEAFRAALENPAGSDAKTMLEALELIVTTIVYFLPEEDDDFESDCGPTGTVFTVGKSTPVAGVIPDIKLTPAIVSEADLQFLESGWRAAEGRTANIAQGFTAIEAYEMGLDRLAELRDFVTTEAVDAQ